MKRYFLYINDSMNSRNIPLELENIIRKRDTQCVYCWSLFNNISKKTQATREHIINDERIITYDNIALCCGSCNASKWAKLLSNWIDSDYCKKKNISNDTVAEIVKQALKIY